MTASHQTIRLSAGRHRSPDDGACVMELASMLAGEPFSDHSASVCPVIGAFLRSYNDHVDDARRQGLYGCAARVLGSADPAAERRRAAICLRWARETFERPPLRVRLLHRMLRCQGPDVDGVYAARAAVASSRPDAHRRVLRFLDELLGTPRALVSTHGPGLGTPGSQRLVRRGGGRCGDPRPPAGRVDVA